jgi:hypothetical protein
MACAQSPIALEGQPFELQVVTGEPTPASNSADQLSYTTTSPVTDLSHDNGSILVGTEEGVFRVGIAGLEPVSVFAEWGEPPFTGAVRAMTPRQDGALIATENGIFHTYESRLLFSPLSDLIADQEVLCLSVAGGGETEETWVGTSNGLFRISANDFEHIVFPDEPGPVTAVSATSEWVLVAFGNRVYELYASEMTSWQVPQDMGLVSDISQTDGTAYIVSDTGVTVRNTDGVYVHYTLSSGVGIPSESATTGYALVQKGLIQLSASGATWVTDVADDLSPGHLELDGYGNVWIGRGHTITAVYLGQGISFSESVAPILESRCGSCHSDGYTAPLHDFGDYNVVTSISDSIITRITTGQMPPVGMPALTSDELETLLGWYATGQNL